MGERAGNTKHAELVAAVHDHTDMRTGVNEARLSSIAQMVETSSGKEIASNSPIVGRDVFTQTAGIHADGDAKGDLYASRLAPARFGRARRYALGKLSGKASLDHNLKTLGIDLDPMEHAIVLERIIELGDRKHTITPEDLPYIIADVLKTPEEQLVRVETYHVVVGGGEEPKAAVKLSFGGAVEEAEATGSGGYDAFMNAVRKAARTFEIDVPRLADYRVRIPPGGRSAALVETVISWHRHASTRPAPGDETFATIGVDADQLGAAVIATEKMLNAVVPRRRARTQKPTKAQKSARSGKSSAHSSESGGSGSSSGSKAR
jgi:D-citramalate synthase